jgi:hypothetical protein
MSFQENLEPVKYNDEGEYYIVHRVLPRGENRFFLKLRNWISEVRLDDERRRFRASCGNRECQDLRQMPGR